MNGKYKKNETVYNYYFDISTNELKYDNYTVLQYIHMDGMQWKVIKEYILAKNVYSKFMIFFKKKKQVYVRFPEELISTNRIEALCKLCYVTINRFGDLKNYKIFDESRKEVIKLAEENLKMIKKDYPEILLKNMNVSLDANTSSLIWR